MKLQHWLVIIEYLPGVENGLADALSREERPTLETVVEDGCQGDVEERPPQKDRKNTQEGNQCRKYLGNMQRDQQ